MKDQQICNNKLQQFKRSMQQQGIDVDTFQQEEKLSSKILEKVIGGGNGPELVCCTHDRSKDSEHDKSIHDKCHDKGIFHEKCTHTK